MYDRDPRSAWTSSMAHYFPGTAGKPADLMKLSPIQLDHLVQSTNKTIAALEQQSKTR